MPSEKRPPQVAIIDNSIEPAVYRPVDHWGTWLDFQAAFVAREGDFPDLRQGFTHLILTGSEASINVREPWVEREAELVREATSQGLAILGSCWGHQLIAYALAGPAHVRPCRRPEIGWLPIRIFGRDELLGPAGEAHSFTLHFDEVTGLDGRFEVLAETEICAVQAFRVKSRPVWGLQPHPEIDPPSGRELLRGLRDRGARGKEDLDAALRLEARDSRLVLRIVRAFLAASVPSSLSR